MPRSDLKVTLDEAAMKLALALGSWLGRIVPSSRLRADQSIS
jgi:hypothetical protein